MRCRHETSVTKPIPELCLLLFVEDPALPRVRIQLADLLRQGGKRPLNVRYTKGQRLRVVLSDPQGVWASAPPVLEIRMGW